MGCCDCFGCLPRHRSRADVPARDGAAAGAGDYASLFTQPDSAVGREDSARELLVVDGDNCPVNLTLTHTSLVAVTRKPGSLHSLKLSHASASSTRTIPYICVLAATCSHPPTTNGHSAGISGSTSTVGVQVTVSALVPEHRSQPDGPLKLWTLQAHVVPEQDLDSPERRAGRTEEGAANGSHGYEAKAEQWCRLAEESAYAGLKRIPKLHCVVNPAGGKGKAKAVWNDEVKPIFDAARATYHVSFTGPPNSPTNASAIASKHPPATYDALVAFSGDGIVHELLNGLANHKSGHGRKALRETPIVHVPCGSGNALATSLLGPEKVTDRRWAALAALKGRPLPVDLGSLTQSSGKRIFTFLSQAFGLMADLDLGTEHLRWMGDARFTYGYVRGALERRTYPLHLDLDIVASSRAEIGRNHNAAVRAANAAAASRHSGGSEGLAAPAAVEEEEGGDALPPLRLPGIFESFNDASTELSELPGRDGVPPGRYSLDLSKEGVFFLYGGKVPFVAKDLMMFPAADPNDGLIDLAIIGSMGRAEALQAMDGAEKGTLFNHRALAYLKVRSYRLTFPVKQGGCISIDGEGVPYEAFQVEMHRGLARVMSLTGKWEGRRVIEGY